MPHRTIAVGVIGTSCSVAAATASSILSEAGLVMISAGNTAPSLTSDPQGNAGANYHPGYFRAIDNSARQLWDWIAKGKEAGMERNRKRRKPAYLRFELLVAIGIVVSCYGWTFSARCCAVC